VTNINIICSVKANVLRKSLRYNSESLLAGGGGKTCERRVRRRKTLVNVSLRSAKTRRMGRMRNEMEVTTVGGGCYSLHLMGRHDAGQVGRLTGGVKCVN
jgi:hypothetical protein